METKTNFNQGVFFNPEDRTDVWATPIDFFNKINERYKLNLDVCAKPSNAKCKNFFTPEIDGLKQKWVGRVWMNPPYGREIKKWIKKAYEEIENGNSEIAVCLVPARTCSAWWHEYCMKGEILFIRHRLKFGGSKINAPFPNALVIFSNEHVNTYKAIDREGNLVI
ncbi:DNA N-6-adenine-methyltransferase [Bacillus velezensis]|uniref:DNA N-6-adenine-methyltransferase n=1 Tax=Bacillus velezensis TaxID=492670 RepID=UPI0022401927